MQWERRNRQDTLAVSPIDLQRYLRLEGCDDLMPQAIVSAKAAEREIEAYAEIALITQTVRASFPGPNLGGKVCDLPVGPVQDSATIAVSALEIDGVLAALTSAQYHLVAGPRATVVLLSDTGLPDALKQCSTRLLIDYEAGYGTSHSSVPSDLQQAILDQASIIFDRGWDLRRRHTGLSPQSARIAARYRGCGYDRAGT